jgi:hypothetical protein
MVAIPHIDVSETSGRLKAIYLTGSVRTKCPSADKVATKVELKIDCHFRVDLSKIKEHPGGHGWFYILAKYRPSGKYKVLIIDTNKERIETAARDYRCDAFCVKFDTELTNSTVFLVSDRARAQRHCAKKPADVVDVDPSAPACACAGAGAGAGVPAPVSTAVTIDSLLRKLIASLGAVGTHIYSYEAGHAYRMLLLTINELRDIAQIRVLDEKTLVLARERGFAALHAIAPYTAEFRV